MDMDLRQLEHIFLVIALMRRFIADHRECHRWPSQHNGKRYCEP
jgi:hypothetical protein